MEVLFHCVNNHIDGSFWKKCFAKITKTMFWIVFRNTLASYRDIVVIQEGFEPREFWMKLGGREKYNIDRKKVHIFYSFYSYWCFSVFEFKTKVAKYFIFNSNIGRTLPSRLNFTKTVKYYHSVKKVWNPLL